MENNTPQEPSSNAISFGVWMLIFDIYFSNCLRCVRHVSQKKKNLRTSVISASHTRCGQAFIWPQLISIANMDRGLSFARVCKRGRLAQRADGPQPLGSMQRRSQFHPLLDPSGQGEHKRALPLHLAALPYPPCTHGEPDSSSSCLAGMQVGQRATHTTEILVWL